MVRPRDDTVTSHTLLLPHTLVPSSIKNIERWCGVPLVMESFGAVLDDINYSTL